MGEINGDGDDADNSEDGNSNYNANNDDCDNDDGDNSDDNSDDDNDDSDDANDDCVLWPPSKAALKILHLILMRMEPFVSFYFFIPFACWNRERERGRKNFQSIHFSFLVEN